MHAVTGSGALCQWSNAGVKVLVFLLLSLCFGSLSRAMPVLTADATGVGPAGDAPNKFEHVVLKRASAATRSQGASSTDIATLTNSTQYDPTGSYVLPGLVPSVTEPSYSVPTSYLPTTSAFGIPTTYSHSVPSVTAPTYSAATSPLPTASSGGGGKTSSSEKPTNTSKIGRKSKTSLGKLIGAIAAGVLAFFSFVGGLWAACKGKLRRKRRDGGSEDPEKVALHDHTQSESTVASLPTLGYQPEYVAQDEVPLMEGGHAAEFLNAPPSQASPYHHAPF